MYHTKLENCVIRGIHLTSIIINISAFDFQNPEIEYEVGETCIKLPPDCMNSQACYLFVSYKYIPSKQLFSFTQGTNETWVLFAVVPDRPHDMVS